MFFTHGSNTDLIEETIKEAKESYSNLYNYNGQKFYLIKIHL